MGIHNFDEEVIGTVVEHHKQKLRSTIVRKGDLRFGCCDDVIIRGQFIYFPLEDYFYSDIGKKFKYKERIEVKWVKQYKEIIRDKLKRFNSYAEFVFTDVNTKTT